MTSNDVLIEKVSNGYIVQTSWPQPSFGQPEKRIFTTLDDVVSFLRRMFHEEPKP